MGLFSIGSVKQENLAYAQSVRRRLDERPRELTDVPDDKATREWAETDVPLIRVLHNKQLTVLVYEHGAAIRVSVSRDTVNDESRREPTTAKDLQIVKDALGYGDRWAVEVYPPNNHPRSPKAMHDFRHMWLTVSSPDK